MNETSTEKTISSKAGTMKLLGGRVCLDFLNTMGKHSSDNPVEYLTGFRQLAEWAQHVEIISETGTRNLLNEYAKRQAEGDAVVARAIELREAMYRIFSALYEGSEPQKTDLVIFNRELPTAYEHSVVVPGDSGFRWSWVDFNMNLDGMLWPVLKDAAELLTSPELVLVRRCSDDRCGQFFIDTSRNHSRRWCDMKVCGNRAKVRRHYNRHK